MNLSLNQLVFVDTVKYNLSNEDKSNPISSADIRIKVKNGFPYSFNLQLYLVDDFGVSDSLVTQDLIMAAPINSNQRVVEKLESELLLKANAQQAERILKGSRFLIKVKANSLGSPALLPVYEEYRMDVKVIANFKYQLAN
jgi:hypothetical protein